MLRKVVRYALGIIGLNQDDVVLASYPRSGSTWVRFFFCNLISLQEWDGQTVDFETLNETMPEFGVNNLMSPWLHKTIPRIVKTHRKYSLIFRGKRAILVVRDPRDVMVSYYHFLLGRRRKPFQGSFAEFIRHPQYGLEPCLAHYDSWRDRANLITRYEELKRDPFKEFERILEFLNVIVDDDLIHEAIRRSDFKSVRSIEEEGHSGREKEFKKEHRFTRSGRTKQWEGYFDERMLEYYEKLKKKFDFRVY